MINRLNRKATDTQDKNWGILGREKQSLAACPASPNHICHGLSVPLSRMAHINAQRYNCRQPRRRIYPVRPDKFLTFKMLIGINLGYASIGSGIGPDFFRNRHKHSLHSNLKSIPGGEVTLLMLAFAGYKLRSRSQSLYAFSSAAFAFAPRGFFAGRSFFGFCEYKMALARETASLFRSARYPFLATWFAIPL